MVVRGYEYIISFHIKNSFEKVTLSKGISKKQTSESIPLVPGYGTSAQITFNFNFTLTYFQTFN